MPNGDGMVAINKTEGFTVGTKLDVNGNAKIDGTLAVSGGITSNLSNCLLADATVPLTADWTAGAYKIGLGKAPTAMLSTYATDGAMIDASSNIGAFAFEKVAATASVLYLKNFTGNNAYFTLAEHKIAYRWSIGIESGDTGLYFRNGYHSASEIMSLSAAGLSVSGVITTPGGTSTEWNAAEANLLSASGTILSTVDTNLSSASGLFLKHDGSVALTANWNAGNTAQFTRVGIGTAASATYPALISLTSATIYSASMALPLAVAQIRNEDTTQLSSALLGFYSAKGSNLWYAGVVGSAASYQGDFVIGGRTASNVLTEKLKIGPDGAITIGTPIYADPSVSGQIWVDGTTLKMSVG